MDVCAIQDGQGRVVIPADSFKFYAGENVYYACVRHALNTLPLLFHNILILMSMWKILHFGNPIKAAIT